MQATPGPVASETEDQQTQSEPYARRSASANVIDERDVQAQPDREDTDSRTPKDPGGELPTIDQGHGRSGEKVPPEQPTERGSDGVSRK